MRISALATGVVGAAVLMGLASLEAQAQTKYFARQFLQPSVQRTVTPPVSDPGSDATYRWEPSSYGEWSSTCSGSATRTRTVECLDAQGVPASDSQCSSAGSKPVLMEGPKLVVTDCSAELKNGGFESALANWTAAGDASVVSGTVSSGTKALRMFSQGDPGYAYQIFRTIPGVTYTVSYSEWRYDTSSYYDAYLKNGPDGAVIARGTHGPAQAYSVRSMTAKATSSTMIVQFGIGIRGGYYIMYVDDVKLSATE